MVSSKEKFILGLLKIKHIDEHQRQRLSVLVAKEFEVLTSELLAATANLKILKESPRVVSKMENKESQSKLSRHNPKDTIRFLNELSRSESYKWFLHSYDSDYPFMYKDYIENASKAFSKTASRSINSHTWKIVHNFLFGSKDPKYSDEWDLIGGDKVKFGWKNLVEWCNENPGLYPSDVELNASECMVKVNPNLNLIHFKDLIREFKYLIEVRTDDNFKMLDGYIKRLLFSEGIFTDFDVKFVGDFENINFYTDVYQVMRGLKIVLKWCHSYKARSTTIVVSMENLNDHYLLSICHVGSHILLPLRSEKISGVNGDMKVLREILYSVCDLSIYSKLEDGEYYSINLLSDIVNDVEKKSLLVKVAPNLGTTYNFSFYKTMDL